VGSTARVPLPPGTDAAMSFARFARSGDDLLERWDGRRLARCVRVAGRVVPFSATVDGVSLDVDVLRAADLATAAAAAAVMVEPLPPSWDQLLSRDRGLRELHSRYAGMRAVRTLDPFVALVHAISAQQVNLRWAATTRSRVAVHYGDEVAVGATSLRVIDVRRLAAAEVADLRALQLTTAKALALVSLAAAVDGGDLDLDRVATLADDEVVSTLVRLRGIGPWTAQWYLARVLGRPVVVSGDLAVRKAVGVLYAEPTAPSPARTLELTAHWGDAALHAQQLVLHALGEGDLRAGGVPSSP
jgi:DNA-3-methyladenine glycosylase II